MIRPFTCLCLAAACGSGLYLYSEKHRTALLDRQIAGVVHETEAARQRAGLLRAEWALLNEPGRLQDMADRYLALKPMAPTQFVQLADLANHLPPPAAPGTAVTDDSTEDDTGGAAPTETEKADAAPPAGQPDADSVPAGTSVLVLPAKQIEPKAAPTLLARTEIAATSKLAGVKAKPPRQAPAEPALAQHDGLLAHVTPLPLAAPQPVAARVYSALARPSAPAYRPPVVAATPRYVSPVAATPRYVSPYVGSALGGGGSLPPPTPYSGN
jgi:hypothetical protein